MQTDCSNEAMRQPSPSTEIKVRAAQVRKAQMNPERFRLVVVSVPNNAAEASPTVRYLLRPLDAYALNFDQSYVPLDVASLLQRSVEPQ